MDSPHLHLAADPDAPSDEIADVAASIRVVLADDHAPMRRSLRLLLDGEEDLGVVAEADDLASTVAHVQGCRPSVLVLGLGMPGGSSGSGGETIRQLRARAPATHIVVVTMDESPVLAQSALAAGALGFVVKDLADEELPQAIRRAARGEQYVSPRVASRLGALDRALVDDRLSAREVEVLRLITLGHTSVEVAHRLHLSPRTVETHRARIHRKLELTTRAELVRYALGRGLLKI
jgi:two-component system, NarL family, response regulator NreC